SGDPNRVGTQRAEALRGGWLEGWVVGGAEVRRGGWRGGLEDFEGGGGLGPGEGGGRRGEGTRGAFGNEAGGGQGGHGGAAEVGGTERADVADEVGHRRGGVAGGGLGRAGQPPPAGVLGQHRVGHLDHQVDGGGVAPFGQGLGDVEDAGPEPVAHPRGHPARLPHPVEQRLVHGARPDPRGPGQVDGGQEAPQVGVRGGGRGDQFLDSYLPGGAAVGPLAGGPPQRVAVDAVRALVDERAQGRGAAPHVRRVGEQAVPVLGGP